MNDEQLIRLSLEGDQGAFGVLVTKYKVKVFNLAYSLTHNRETADDLTQEVFLKAYMSLSSFKFKSGFGTWLYRITVNHAHDFLRKEKKVKTVPFLDERKNEQTETDPLDRRVQADIARERQLLVRRTLRSLPEKHRTILTLRDIQGISYEEIAKILRIAPGTVDSRLHRARKLLHTRMAPSFSPHGGDT